MILAPDRWEELPCGELYRESIEERLKPWFTKMYGLHLIKIGNLSTEIDSKDCTIHHQINVSLGGQPKQIIADPLHLPFAANLVDACLIAHTIPWCSDPYGMLREASRVLIDNGWLALSSFNPVSIIGLRKLVTVSPKNPPYNSKMFTMMQQLHWLFLLNFEILHYSSFHVLPWKRQGGKLLNTYLPVLGCLQLIIARKRMVPMTLNKVKKKLELSFT